MQERRRFPRIEFELKLKVFEDRQLTRLKTHDAVVYDISKVGISFVTHQKLNKGDKFYMQFELMGGLKVTFYGELIWIKTTHVLYTYGVRYIKISWGSMRNLDQGLLSHHFPEQKSAMFLILEYILLMLLVVMLTQFLNKLPIPYTIGIFLVFLGALYYILINRRD